VKDHLVAKNVLKQNHHEQNLVLSKPFLRKIHSGEKLFGCKECHIAVEHVTTTLFTAAPIKMWTEIQAALKFALTLE